MHNEVWGCADSFPNTSLTRQQTQKYIKKYTLTLNQIPRVFK